ncbi:MAG: hypothetical protein ACOC22_00400 [bacterium]
MFKIEYDVKISENGRPYIDLPDDNANNVEDRFFVIEMTRYILQGTLRRNNDRLTPEIQKHMENTEIIIGQVGDEMAKIIHAQMKNLGEYEFIVGNNYHIQVDTIEQRNSLPLHDILYNGKLFDRREGLKVFVVNEENIYVLTNGIENENWTLIE